MNRREARRIARFRAGLILESAISAGWWPDDLVDDHGEEAVGLIASEIIGVANWLAPPNPQD